MREMQVRNHKNGAYIQRERETKAVSNANVPQTLFHIFFLPSICRTGELGCRIRRL